MWSCFPLNLWWKEGYIPFVNNMICGKISRDKRYFVNLQAINRWKSAFPLNCKRNIMKLVPIKMPKREKCIWLEVLYSKLKYGRNEGWVSYPFHTKYLKFSLIFSCNFFSKCSYYFLQSYLIKVTNYLQNC